jgi:hypothetical protein
MLKPISDSSSANGESGATETASAAAVAAADPADCVVAVGAAEVGVIVAED